MHFSRNRIPFLSMTTLGFYGLIALSQANLGWAAIVTGTPAERNPSFFPFGGDEVEVLVQLDDTAVGPGNILVTVHIIPGPNNVVGDIRAVYFHIADESLLASNFSVAGADVDNAKAIYNANEVDRFVRDNTNINPYGIFDMGFEIGLPGAGLEGRPGDDIHSTSFVLSNSSFPLDVSLFEGQEFGVRLAQVGPADNEILRRDSTQRDAKQIGRFSVAVPEPSSLFACSLLTAFGISRSLRRTRKPKLGWFR